jgi:hypothetical protein
MPTEFCNLYLYLAAVPLGTFINHWDTLQCLQIFWYLRCGDSCSD